MQDFSSRLKPTRVTRTRASSSLAALDVHRGPFLFILLGLLSKKSAIYEVSSIILSHVGIRFK